ncbi:MAG: class I SAM-dependent methyltransferase [Deltaproteobacteria bacterium]|nr:class I SAM-dependent methyltransferase [Deltaproteobacteria bacterium]
MTRTEHWVNFLDKTAKLLPTERDRDFFLRVYKTSEDVYRRRLRGIGFLNMESVLDAGCGFGQWSIALASLNKEVHSVELDADRLRTAKCVAQETGAKNITFMQGNIEEIAAKDESFDAIFCYSVIYYTDFRKTLREFFRLLKPKGKLYFSTNGLGWYIHNIIDKPYPSADFDPRQIAIETIKNSFEFFRKGDKTEPGSIVMPRHIVIEALVEAGFNKIIADGEGKINSVKDDVPPISFFKESYYGEEGVYEILCEKQALKGT